MVQRVPWYRVGFVVALLASLLFSCAPWADAPERAERKAPQSPPGETLTAPALAGVPRAQGPRRSGIGASESAAAADPVAPLAEIPLRVSAFDVHTGRAVQGTWSPRGGPATAAPYSREQVEDPEAFARAQEQEARNAERGLQEYRDSFVALGEVARELLDTSELVNLYLSVRPTDGWVLLESQPWLEPWIRLGAYRVAGAREAVAYVPSAREAPLELVVLGPDGHGAEGVELALVELSGNPWQAGWVETLGPGRLRVLGLPHLPGEPVTAYLVWRADEDGLRTEDSPEAPSEEPPEPQLQTTVPASLAEPWRVIVRLPGPIGDLPYSESSGLGMDCSTHEESAPATGPTGSVRVRAQGLDGRTPAEAIVAGKPVDADGHVLLTDLVAGRRTLRLSAPGRLHADGEVEVVAGREVALLLREPRGGRLDVRVVDPEGRPRPGALLALDKSWYDVVDGVQRLDLWCDQRGRRTLERVQLGPCRLRAQWGSRRGEVEVTVRDEETTRVEIVAR